MKLIPVAVLRRQSPGILQPDITLWNKALAVSASDLQLQRQERLHLLPSQLPFLSSPNKRERSLSPVASERTRPPCGRPRPARNESGPPVMMLSPSCGRGGVGTIPQRLTSCPPRLVPDDGN